MRRYYIYIIVTLIVALSSCRTEEVVISSTKVSVTDGVGTSEYMGFFLLNEGNMGSNKATLDYFDYASGCYQKNIFAERNPNVARELGDVGNDLKINGSRLYAVINCSNLVEVMDLETAVHIGEVSVASCRYIAFSGGYGYVSSYAGEVESGGGRLGQIVKFDLSTLESVGSCGVGYQPEQMAIIESRDQLWVTNSGGYKWDGSYDNRVMVIDLESFSVVASIEVADNLHNLLLGGDGLIYVSSRGDYDDIASATYTINPSNYEVTKIEGLPNSKMSLNGDQLYVLTTDFDTSSGGYCLYNTSSKSITDTNFINDGSESLFTLPYSLATNSETGEFFVTDAKDYLTPGTIHCYSSAGYHKWSTTTGDIPSSIAFTTVRLSDDYESGPSTEEEDGDTTIHATFTEASSVVDYSPAPGQYIWTWGDCEGAYARLGGNYYLSLGAWGGSVTVEFGGAVLNGEGYDIAIKGNQFATSNEPGIVWVSSGGLWYELEGSESDNTDTVRNYTKEYSEDGRTYNGTKLPSNITGSSGSWVMNSFDWGYVDNSSSIDLIDGYNMFDIDNAIDGTGDRVSLTSVDYVKIQTGVDATTATSDSTGLGEVSTEVVHIKARR